LCAGFSGDVLSADDAKKSKILSAEDAEDAEIGESNSPTGMLWCGWDQILERKFVVR
jgi:hypothetical protein